ncbi:MAG TPA: hypothetical protein VK530_09805 [Candidatus Acidoferrum sp.]|nr:hypothetical protein [Candidatus Acidoferrum sp.]
MKRMVSFFLAAGLLNVAEAQIPGMITYQGRVTSSGTNFSGTGQFKFALVRGNNPAISDWSNDGTPGGAQPVASVSLFVTNGLFNALLGDTSMAGMTMAIPPTAFTNSDLRLRVWFSAGEAEFTQLAPDQRITSVGYAMRAANVMDGAITGAQIAPGSITNIHLANNAITSAKISDTLTLQTLHLGSVNWDGTLNVYSEPEGGGGVGSGFGDLRARLAGRDTNGTLELFGATGFPAFRASANTDGGTLRLEDDSGFPAITMGALQAGGFLNVWRPAGNFGVNISGGGPTDPGGEMSLYHASPGGSRIGIFLDADSTAGAGEVSVRDNAGVETIELLGSTSSGQGSSFTMRNGLGDITLSLDADASGRGSSVSLFNGTNDATVFIDANSGGAGLIELRNNLGAARAELDGQGTSGGGEVVLRDEDGTATVVIEGAEGVGNGAQIALYRGTGGTASIILDADFNGEGRVTTQVLEITGGSDLSENFDIHSIDARPGMIVCIDPARPGELKVSANAYDRTVAGVVSGAGGVKPGMLMGQRGTLADGKQPVALTGRVYCWVDASRGAIAPGDLITTSETPGHGMKVAEHTRAHGAIIGKAMTPLSDGKGLVLVLVSLQ